MQNTSAVSAISMPYVRNTSPSPIQNKVQFGKKEAVPTPGALVSWLERFGWAEVRHTKSDRHPNIVEFTRPHQAKHPIHMPNSHHGDNRHIQFVKEVATVLRAPVAAVERAVALGITLAAGRRLAAQKNAA